MDICFCGLLENVRHLLAIVYDAISMSHVCFSYTFCDLVKYEEEASLCFLKLLRLQLLSVPAAQPAVLTGAPRSL